MKLFDSLKKAQANQARPTTHNSIASKIIAMFYADYPEIPYISPDRKSDWIEMAQLFPKITPVQKQMMQRFANGLLPGHVYMLYWLKKYTNKKVPSYFEYKYGIDFEKEKAFLHMEGFLDSTNKPTAKGEKAIEIYSKVIENHAPKRDLSVKATSKQILEQHEDDAEYYAWLDYLEKGGTTADWEKAKKKKK